MFGICELLRYAIQINTNGFRSVPEYLSILINKLWLYAIQLIPDKMHKGDILSSNTNNLYNSDRVPLIHLDQLPKILICKLSISQIQFCFSITFICVIESVFCCCCYCVLLKMNVRICLYSLYDASIGSIHSWSNSSLKNISNASIWQRI